MPYGVRLLQRTTMQGPWANCSTLPALLLTAVLVSPRPRAEYLFIGPTVEISDLAFKQAAGMIEIDPVLSAKFLVQHHIKKITYRPTGAFLKVKSFSPTVVTGSKPSGVLIDEIHVIGEMNNADRVIGQLRGGHLHRVILLGLAGGGLQALDQRVRVAHRLVVTLLPVGALGHRAVVALPGAERDQAQHPGAGENRRGVGAEQGEPGGHASTSFATA